MNKNLILNTDSYKTSHYLQYPPGTSHISSYIEARGGNYQQAVFFGLQIFLKQYLVNPITAADINQARDIVQAHGLPFNEAGWRHILQAHGGLLPISIQALAEGTPIAMQNALVQVVNTDPRCAWLTSYIETALLRAIWYPTTVATVSYRCKQIIAKYLELTADSSEGLVFKLHDFGARGASTEEAAGIGGAAHLVNFWGTDTISGLLNARHYYHAEMAGFSIPAAEHSTITAWGKAGETQAYRNMLDQFGGPDRLLAVVSDSYDLWHAIDHIWGGELKQQVKSSGGTLVIRPDSGDPVSVVCETLERLMARFGYITNAKGYRELPPYLRVIQGDGVDENSIAAILAAMEAAGLSAENIAFGMGGALLQKVNRDTLKFAMKTNAVKIDGEWRDVHKCPITDSSKRSKKGRLAVIEHQKHGIQTIPESDLAENFNLLETVFADGELLKEIDFDTVRANAAL